MTLFVQLLLFMDSCGFIWDPIEVAIRLLDLSVGLAAMMWCIRG